MKKCRYTSLKFGMFYQFLELQVINACDIGIKFNFAGY